MPSRLLAKIEERLEALGLTDAAACDRAGTPDFIKNLRTAVANGHPYSPTVRTLERMAAALGVETSSLISSGSPLSATYSANARTMAGRLSTARMVAALTQSEVAERVRNLRGISFTQQAYAALENGVHANSLELPAICEVLKVDLRWIRDGEVTPVCTAAIDRHFIEVNEDLEFRAWRLLRNRTPEELARIVAVIEAAFPR